MKPITYAKITFFLASIQIMPEILYLVIKILIGGLFKNSSWIEGATGRVHELFQYRVDKTKQTFSLHKNTYLFQVVQKRY